MSKFKFVLAVVCVAAIGLAGCSREQSDWEKARASNNADSYELFVKKYPSGSFTAQAQARLKELYEERDWQKARDADTSEAYQTFLKQYPEGKWTEEARIRVENFSLAQAPSGGPAAAAAVGGEAAAPMAPTAAPTSMPPAPATGAAVGAAAAAAAAGTAAAVGVAAAAKPAAASGSSGSYGVQLGAFAAGRKAAEAHWALLLKKESKELAGLSPKIRSSKTSKGTLYRLQVTGLSQGRAEGICKALKARGQACSVLKPAHRPHAKKKAHR